MDKMKTFLMYLLIIVAFFIISKILEDGLIKQMYYDMQGKTENILTYEGQDLELDLSVSEAKATRRNGYIYITVTNETPNYISEAYVKADLFSKSNVKAITKYIEISGLSQGETRTFELRFSGSYIDSYMISLTDNYPDKRNIINIFGYDINTSNIFGMDLSEYINAENFESLGDAVYDSAVYTVESIPWWGWLWAWCIFAGVL